MAKEALRSLKISTLVSVVVHGATSFGLQLVKTLSEQGSRVIVIDTFSKEKKDLITQLKNLENVDFIDVTGIKELFGSITKFDYLFYLQNSYFASASQLDSKAFLEESSLLEQTLQAATRFKAKSALVTSVEQHKQILRSRYQNEPGSLSPYSAAETQKYSETLAAEFHDKSSLDIRILRMATILGSGFHGEEDPELNEFFEQSVNSTQITIRGEGLNNHYIVHYSDAIYGLLKLTFDPKTSGEVVTVSNPKPLTSLSVAYKLLELNTEAQNIKFDSDNSDFLLQDQYTPSTSAIEYGWDPKISVENIFLETVSSLYDTNRRRWANKPDESQKASIASKDPASDRKVKTESAKGVPTPLGSIVSTIFSPFVSIFRAVTPKSKITLKSLIYVFGSTVILLLLSYYLITPIVSIGINTWQISKKYENAYTQLAALQIRDAKDDIDSMNQDVRDIQIAVERLEWAFNITGQDELYENVSQLSFAGGYALQGAATMSEALLPMETYIREFEPAVGLDNSSTGITRQYATELNELRANRPLVKSATADLVLASAMIDGLDIGVFPDNLHEHLIELKEANELLSTRIEPFDQIIQFLPELLGVDSRQRYLVLLQNPSEIRSTGGWLSSYALVGLEGGQIRQLEVDDIYNIDGQLSLSDKTYKPPQSMIDALGVDQWSMSLSNWNPDFPSAADDAQFFIRESGKSSSIDGVIAIDLNLVKLLLDRWDGITVTGQNQKVTSRNVDQIIFQIHEEFTPGSSRKTTFIANLADAVLNKLFSSDGASYQDLASVLFDGLEQKHIQLSFNNPSANRYFASRDWDGSLQEKNRSAPASIEWNWGANKANLYLESTNNLDIELLGEDEIRYTFTRSIENTSMKRTYPEGDYINWHRVYLPENARITLVNGYEDNNYNTTSENGFSAIGGWFNTEIDQRNELKIGYRYARPSGQEYYPLSILDREIRFDFTLFKQAGVDEELYNVTIYYPQSWALKDAEGLNRSSGQLSTSITINQDTDYSVTFQK